MRRARLVAALALALAACHTEDGAVVDLTIAAGPTLPETTAARITGLEVSAAGAVMGHMRYPVDHPFAGGATQRIVVRPAASAGELRLEVTAYAGEERV